MVQRVGPVHAVAPPSPLLAVPNVTAHPSTASVATSYYLVWHYNCLWTLKGYTAITRVVNDYLEPLQKYGGFTEIVKVVT